MKQKSFNCSAAAALRSSMRRGAAAGAASCLAVACSWEWLRYEALSFLSSLAAFGAPAPGARPAPPGRIIESPTAALSRVLGSGDAGPFLLACAAALSMGLLLGLSDYVSRARRLHDGTWVGGRRAPGASVHGDARLVSSPRELGRASFAWREGERPRGGALAVGELGRSVMLIDSVHACVLGGSGDGKSRRIAIATCLANFLEGRSLVVNDVKGELRAYLEPYFLGAGTHRVVDVMFDDPGASVRFDPLRLAKDAFAAEGAGGAARELRELARCIVPTATSGQPFFNDNARNLFIGLSLRLISDPEIPEEQKTVMSVAAAISPRAGQSPLDRIGAIVASMPPGDPALPFLAGLNGERGGGPGVVSTLATYLAEYVDQNVARMLHDDEAMLSRIGEEPTVVFVSSSSATGNYRRLVQTFMAGALSSLRGTAARHAGRCPVETAMVLDEAASLGRNERMIQDLGEMRSEGIRVVWFCQSLLQLQSVSGYTREEAETILDLLKDRVVLSCTSYETARLLSDSMGCYTAVAESRSRTRGARSGGSVSASEGLVRRPLIAPDELMRWRAKETGVLVIKDGVPMAFPSKDVSETFVGEMLGMTSPEAERSLMEAALARRAERNGAAPDVWEGPEAPAPPEDGRTPARREIAGEGYSPEGF